jgi:hypothetical protein
MKLTDIQARFTGQWTGSNTLWLSWLPNPEHKSVGTITIEPVAQDKFLLLRYTWEHDGKAQDGVILVGNNTKDALASASWVDSFHQSGHVMQMTGTITDDGMVVLQGQYPAPPGPDWGWQITINPLATDQLRLEMYNISPKGDSELAVRAEYSR